MLASVRNRLAKKLILVALIAAAIALGLITEETSENRLVSMLKRK
jgi:hypothetical protein